MSIYPQLYRKDSKGLIRIWFLEDNGLGQYRSHAGLEASDDLVTSGWTQCHGKNAGKKNATTDIEQCLKEIEAQYEHKLARKYARSIAELDSKDIVFPMLADKFKALEPGIQYYCQPKLDGIRCMAYLKDGSVYLQSRQGKQFTFLPHLEAALKPILEAFPEVVLDGELYNHELREDFNGIVSAVKGGDPEKAKLVQYHVYDVARNGESFGWRIMWLRGAISRLCPPEVVFVQTHTITNSLALDALYTNYLDQGYEGQMVRADGPYEEGKRSKLLLKRKVWQDAEFPIVELRPGKGIWSHAARIATLLMPNGKTSEADVVGTKEQCEEILNRWRMHLSAPAPVATTTFFNYTDEGRLRFGKVRTIWWSGRDL